MAALTIENNCEYDAYFKRWAKVRAFNNGEDKLKEFDLKRVGVLSSKTVSDAVSIAFLRLINPTDTSSYNTQRNINMINGAVLFNGVVKTRSGLLGMLYRKPPVEAELPDSINYIYDNVDGSGLSMTQQSRSVSSDVVSVGRDGLLTDMPRNDEGNQLTAADVNNGFRASIQEYKAESIVDWHESIINNVKVLDLLVLCEVIEKFVANSINTREKQKQYKVYRLTDVGVTVQIFTDNDSKGFSQDGKGVPVLGANNTQLTGIPFVFVGSKNNQPSVDNLPLEPIANVNAGHYQESANLASSSFQLSACQPWIASDTYAKVAQDKSKNGESVELGEDSLVIVEAGGSFNFASPPPNPLSKSVQDGYKEQMIELGAQLITSGGMAETAEAARLKHASDVSDLEVMSDNISNAYTKSLEHVCIFMGAEYKEEYIFRLNSEFFEMKLTADNALKLVQVWQGGAITKDVLDSNLVAGKVIADDVDLDEMNKEIDSLIPAVNLDE